jgi:hypothetical protein
VSIVFDYLKTTYSNCCNDAHSWQVINSSMRKALEVAVSGRFKFELDDFEVLADTKQSYRGFYGQFGFYRWIGKDTEHGHGERIYKLAIDSNNKSACLAFEYWQKRKPFIFKGQRLGIGSSIQTLTEDPYFWWLVGSFSESGEKINLSSDNRRKSLTVKDLKALEKKELERVEK